MWYCAVAMPGFSAAIALEPLVPERHGVDDAVRLGRRRHRLPRPLGGAGEGVAHDPVGAEAGEDRSPAAAISWSVPLCIRPPISEYSPSLFSRMISMSMSPGFCRRAARARRRTGGPAGHWRIAGSRGGSASGASTATSGSGTFGQPIAPRKIASWPAMRLRPSSGIIRPKRA